MICSRLKNSDFIACHKSLFIESRIQNQYDQFLIKFTTKISVHLENKSYYTTRISESQKLFTKANSRYQFFGTLRLLTFISMLLVGYFFWGNGIVLGISSVLIILFVFLINLSVKAKYNRDKLKKIIEINENELKVLEGNWLFMRDGNEYKNSKHAFSHDLDLFGPKSFFQLINRTVSKKGSDQLAKQLLAGVSNTQLSNEATADLSLQMDWCQEFLAEGLILKEEHLKNEFQNIKNVEGKLSPIEKILRFLIPIGSLTIVFLYSFEVISGSFLGAYIVLILGLMGTKYKNTTLICTNVTGYSGQVKMFLKQLDQYRNLPIQSGLFIKERDLLFKTEHNLQDSLIELEKIQGRMDSRMNLLVGLMLNFFLAWDILVIGQWEKWRKNNENHLGSWEKHLAQLEVWISAATYKFNYPEATFASFNKDERINILAMGHPFVSKTKRVLNNVSINKEEQFLIITGPNMAGKSTYLRSLGLAFICANAGFPVLAESCTLPKLKLYSSMRTSDDLSDESSYFHSELSRLRFIMDAIDKGEQVFIILDEILKGTNSKDKEIGSAKFLEKLKRLNAKGVIATHDLSLCNLANGDSAFRNMYFDSTISENDLSFDYKIRQGICKNMNASFLLKKMDLVD